MKNGGNSSHIKLSRRGSPVRVTINTSHTKRLREYFKEVTFSRADFDMKSWEWLAPGLAMWARDAAIAPKPMGLIDELQSGLAIAMRLPAWKSLTQDNPKDATPTLVTKFFIAFDNELSCLLNRSDSQISRLSQTVRRFIREYLAEKCDDPLVIRAAERYQTPHSAKSVARPLISDMPNHLRPTISAIPHVDISDLKAKTGKLLVDDLNNIRDVCHGILKRFELAISELNALCSLVIPEEEEAELRVLCAESTSALQNPLILSPARLEYLLALAVQIASGVKSPLVTRRPSTQGLLFENSSKLLPILKQRLFGFSNGSSITQFVKLEIAPPLEVLLACGLVIQCHTGWNFTSVLQLQRDQIDIVNLPHEFQSIKVKTGDHTPYAVVERSDEAVVAACRYLVRRLDLLIQAGYADKNDQRIFLNPLIVLRKSWASEVVAGWDLVLAGICKDYGLPKFSFDQIRTQKLSAIRYGPKGIEGAQQAGGHARVATTGEYIDQLINRRLNSAINLEFQRRFDSTIRYMITPQEVAKNQRLIAYPIGDGASCAAPKEPPDESWLSSGVCNAASCHVGDGCPHRRLLVTKERIEEVVRTKDYYVQNWTRLINENSDAFEKVHAPAMVFNIAFYGVLSRGPYRHLVRQYES